MSNKPLRILHIYGGAMKIGGHYRSGLAMAKGLIKRGDSVTVIAPSAVPEMKSAYEQAGAEFILLPETGLISKLPSLAGWRKIIEIINQNNIDIIHAMDSVNLARGYRSSVETGKPFFCTEAGANFTTHFPPRKAKVIIFSGEQMEIYRNIYRTPSENVKLIPARIEQEYYHPAQVSEDFISKYGLDTEGIKIGIVTRLVESKIHKILSLIDFADSYRRDGVNVNIYIVGEGDFREKLQSEAAKVDNPSAKLHFLGSISDIEEVNFFYNFCDVVMGSGRGIMEAMACRKPVVILGKNDRAALVGPDNVDLAAYYNFSGRHFRHEENAENISKVLDDICADPEKLTDFADFGFDYVREHLAADKGAEKLQDWYLNKPEKNGFIDFILWYIRASCRIVKVGIKYKLYGYGGRT